MGPSSTTSGLKEAYSPRRHFYLFEAFNSFWNRAKVGFLFVFPLCVAFFSVTWAFRVVSVVLLSYWGGVILQEITYWYNSRADNYQEKAQLPLDLGPTTEINEILERVRHFENKYYVSIEDMYRYLDEGKVPFDNLDWIEVVSLLNRLSLNVGKHFDGDKSEKGKKQK